MGTLILCSGLRTQRPYVFPATGIRVYTIEELCYYIESHIYFIDQDTFTYALFDWIGTELGLADRAEKLKLLKNQKADSKTLLAAVLCSADYYTEPEIKSLIRTVDELNGMTPLKRSSLRAFSYLKNRKYREAAFEYEQLLNSKEAADMTPEEYGDILHNLAVARIHSKGLSEASETFLQAYERNHRQESARQYLYTLRLSNKMEQFHQKAEEYQIGNELCEDILLTMEELHTQAIESEGMSELNKIKQLKADGRLSEYRKRIDDMLENWMSSLRQI